MPFFSVYGKKGIREEVVSNSNVQPYAPISAAPVPASISASASTSTSASASAHGGCSTGGGVHFGDSCANFCFFDAHPNSANDERQLKAVMEFRKAYSAQALEGSNVPKVKQALRGRLGRGGVFAYFALLAVCMCCSLLDAPDTPVSDFGVAFLSGSVWFRWLVSEYDTTILAVRCLMFWESPSAYRSNITCKRFSSSSCCGKRW